MDNSTSAMLPDSPEWQAYLQRVANQRAFLQQAADQAAERLAEHRRVLALAEKRAEELFLFMLDEQQTRQYRDHQCIELTSRSDGRTYRILTRGSAEGNVKILDEHGQIESSWCAAPRDMPVHDRYLAQLLLLTANPQAFFAVANRY